MPLGARWHARIDPGMLPGAQGMLPGPMGSPLTWSGPKKYFFLGLLRNFWEAFLGSPNEVSYHKIGNGTGIFFKDLVFPSRVHADTPADMPWHPADMLWHPADLPWHPR